MLEPYNILYRGVLCSAVDWSSTPSKFVFTVNNTSYIHEQVGEYDCSADTDHILCVIDEFIAKKNKGSGSNQFDAQLHYKEADILNALRQCQEVPTCEERDCKHCVYSRWLSPTCQNILHRDALLLLLSKQSDSLDEDVLNCRHEDPKTDKKQNVAYWDQIDHISETYIKELLKHSDPAIESLDHHDLIEMGKLVTEFTIDMLEKRCKVDFPVIDGDF